MPLKPLFFREVVRKLKRVGFVEVSQKGSHVKLTRTLEGSPSVTVIVPKHREIPLGTLRSIIRQSGLTVDDFMGL